MLAFYLALIDEPNDKEIFAEIYRGYREKMYREAMSILNNHALAEEAVQESLLKIAKNISCFFDTNKNKTAALVTIIVRNVSLDIIKAEHLNETVPVSEDIPDITMDVLSGIISDEGYNELIAYFQKLDIKYRDVLSLRLAYGYDYAAISEMLGIPKRTAETRYYRGIKILKEQLEERYGKC